MKKKILLLMIPILLLSACTQAPDDVKQKADILDGNVTENNSRSSETSDVDDAETLSVGTLEEVRNQLQSDLQNNQTRIRVDDAYVGTGNKMPTYNIKVRDGGFDGFKDLLNMLYGDKFDAYDDSLYFSQDRTEMSDPSYTIYTDDPYDFNYINANVVDFIAFQRDGDFDAGGYSLVAHNTGTIFGSPYSVYATEDGSDNYYYHISRPLEEIIQVDKDDLSKSYPMADGTEWKLSDAIKYAEELFNNEYLMAFDSQNITFEVRYIYLYELENGNYGYFFRFYRKDENGNYLDSCQDVWPKSTAQIKAMANGEPFFTQHDVYLWCVNVDEIARLVKAYSFEYDEATDSGDKLLTLNEAISVLDNSIASQKSVYVPFAELSYVMCCKSFPFYDSWGVDKTEDCYFETVALMNCDFEVRPMWVFKNYSYLEYDFGYGEVYYVDAVTGEMHIIDVGDVIT